MFVKQQVLIKIQALVVVVVVPEEEEEEEQGEGMVSTLVANTSK